MMPSAYMWYILAWPVAAYIILYSCRRSSQRSVGLPLAYFTGLLMIHFVGALLYLLPNYKYYNPYIIFYGFRETTIGLFAFCGGVLVIKLNMNNGRKRSTSAKNIYLKQIDYRLPFFYLGFGLFAYLLGMPLIGRLPTISAIVSGCTQLLVVGVCIGMFLSAQQGNWKKFKIWLFVSCFFPLFTMINSGFLGYGTHSLITVIAFSMFLIRVRFRTILFLCLGIFLGLSLFVTYMRDRTELRNVMWYQQQSYKSKVDVLSDMFSDFEFFDFKNKRHLRDIDRRLNQNHLVGAAKQYIGSNRVDYAYGETIVNAIIALVPRIIWPNKPAVGGGGDLVSKYTGIQFSGGTSVGAGQVLEFYVNFGRSGVISGFFLLGCFIAFVDNKAAKELFSQNYRGFVLWFLPGLGFLQAGGNLIEVVTTVGASIGSAMLATKMAAKYHRRKKKAGTSGILHG